MQTHVQISVVRSVFTVAIYKTNHAKAMHSWSYF